MKKLIALLLVLVMVAGLVACAGSNDETKGNDTTNTENTADSNGDSNTDSGEPIYIGLSAKITGADAANGDRMVKAAQMAVDEVNAAGGLLGGRKVELVIQDDATDNAIAVNVANIFAGNDKISAVVGPWNSGIRPRSPMRLRRCSSSARATTRKRPQPRPARRRRTMTTA